MHPFIFRSYGASYYFSAVSINISSLRDENVVVQQNRVAGLRVL